MNTLLFWLIVYLVSSVILGILDCMRLDCQSRHFDTIPQGDIGYFEIPARILGIHNIIFLPSLLIVGTVILISRIK